MFLNKCFYLHVETVFVKPLVANCTFQSGFTILILPSAMGTQQFEFNFDGKESCLQTCGSPSLWYLNVKRLVIGC